MEHSRIIIAIVLSLLVMVVWDFLFVPKQPPPQPPVAAKKDQAKDTGSAQKVQVNEQSPALQPFLPKKEEAQKAEADKADDSSQSEIRVDTPFYTAAFLDASGVVKSFKLKKYNETIDEDSPNKELITDRHGSVFLSLAQNSLPALPTARFTPGTTASEIKVTDKPQSLTFSWTSPTGVVVEKTYTFHPDQYVVDLDVVIKNQSDKPLEDSLVLSLVNKKPEGTSRYVFVGPSLFLDGSLKELKLKDLPEKGAFTGQIDWVAYEARYFITAVMPKGETAGASHFSAPDTGVVISRLIHPGLKLPAGSDATSKYRLYFGPKRIDDLKMAGNRLEDAVDFGFFDILAKPCLWLMNEIYKYIPNYGVAIILLTILIKIALWPLGTKSYKSMADMKKIQPLMTEVRQKYASDKKKMNEELMRLYRTYKINPMGGCLPMVVQIPVFFALYRMLYEAVELRHAPFFGWIQDLSAPDRLFHFGFSIPFMEPPYGIPVLTIVMGATMFFQQKMSPPMGDSTQAKLMMFMPIIFTVIFINFSSGLVLYWLVNNVISIGQQYYIQKKVA